MIVAKNKEQPKLNKVAVAAPQAAATSTTQTQACAVKTAAAPYASAVSTASAPQACAYTQIQDRAFAIFEKRGSRHGHDLQDWLRAERQVMQAKATAQPSR